jgi:hypothetical protein
LIWIKGLLNRVRRSILRGRVAQRRGHGPRARRHLPADLK